ncbi:MAG: hypothetical protein JJU36_12630 [Phycisphaeraceae bacterium]|nr:hypothetical protein [Phycisphaeraceae bacterium]
MSEVMRVFSKKRLHVAEQGFRADITICLAADDISVVSTTRLPTLATDSFKSLFPYRNKVLSAQAAKSAGILLLDLIRAQVVAQNEGIIAPAERAMSSLP